MNIKYGGFTMENKMFCFQCQETAGCSGCTKFGVCGKSPDLAKMQDLLIYTTKGLSEVTTRLRAEGKEISGEVNHLITINLFTTITNANFDDAIFYDRVKTTLDMKADLLSKLDNKEKNRVIKIIKKYIKNNEKDIKNQKESIDDLTKLLTDNK